MKNKSTDEILKESQVTLRRIAGILGILLPVVLVLWGFALSGWSIKFQDSISDYYSLRTRDALVGILFAIGWILYAYKGYDRMDHIAGILACFLALGVAFFPNSGGIWDRRIHFSCAAGLFVVLAFFSLFLFTKTKESPKDLRGTVTRFRFGRIESDDPKMRLKKKRNKVYLYCGLFMVLCILLTLLYYAFWQNTAISVIKPVLVFETLMVWAFSTSWLIKGETLWRDK